MQEETIINRIAGSGLVTLDLEAHYPKVEIADVDLKTQLVEGLMLREKDLREFVRSHDWSLYQGKIVGVHCSADAIVPTWAFMLLSIALQPHAKQIVFGNKDVALAAAFREALDQIDWSAFRDKKVVVKGCGDKPVPESVFVETAARLRGMAASIMYGEPCSTVPLFKKSKAGG